MTYDGLGRLRVRTQPGQNDGWTYDTAANGIGMLAGATGSNAGYSRTLTYDSLSRPSQVTLTINGTSYPYNRSYNSDGRLATLSYPSGFVAKYVYTALGYLAQIQDNATSAVLWTAKSRDAEMHLTEAQTGSGGVDTIQYFDPKTGLVEQIRASNDGSDDGSVANLSTVFDTIGNLSSRSDTYGGSEQFCYDALNRLTQYSLNGASCHAGGTLKTVAYDDTGNISNKSDLADPSGGTGAYTYNLPGHPLPHAVMSISGTVNGVKDPGYRYDADGNLTCEYTGTNCSHGAITKETDAYWSFNMTHTIGDGATSLTLTYDSEHARITQLLTTASTSVTTNYLNDPISGAMAEKVVSGSTNTWNDYLMVDGKLVGERVCAATAPSCPAASATWQYFILDHLGSVSVVTDGATNQVTARESFDAWGKQRNADWSDDTTCSSGLTAPTTRGFTSQEDIASLCLVNLNARLYDPSIGRFMSADSTVPDPYDGQSYNRYTYVDNRPLSFTDPTGHDPDMSQNFIDAHPEMECMGSCGGVGGVAVMTGTMSAPDGTVLGTYKIVANSNGNMAMGMNCGEGCGALGDMVASNMGATFSSISDTQQAFQTQAEQNTQSGTVSPYGAEPSTAPDATTRGFETLPAARTAALEAELVSEGGVREKDTSDTDMAGKSVTFEQFLMPDNRVDRITSEYFASQGQTNGTSGSYRYFDDRASLNSFLNASGANGKTNFQNGWGERYGNSAASQFLSWIYGGAANPGWSGSLKLYYQFDGAEHGIAVQASEMVQITYWHEYSHIVLHNPSTTVGEEQSNKYGLMRTGLYP